MSKWDPDDVAFVLFMSVWPILAIGLMVIAIVATVRG
jgi:hypothetical protein